MNCGQTANSSQLSAEDFIDLVFFRSAGYLFGVEAFQIRGSGLFDDRQLTSIESLLGQSMTNGIKENLRQILVIKGDELDTEVSVEAPVELDSIPIESVYPLPELVAARISMPGVVAIAITSAGAVPLLDLNAVLSASAGSQ